MFSIPHFVLALGARLSARRLSSLAWNEECATAVSRMTGGSAELIEVAGVICPQDGKFEEEPPEGVPVLGQFGDLRNALRGSRCRHVDCG